MRKRAQFKSKPVTYEPKHVSVVKSKTFDKKSIKISKNCWVAIALISIFFLVLFFNTYFNFTSEIAIYPDGEGYSKYMLSGPDPYYNLRIVEETSKTGIYQYYSENDPLLNYPLGRSGGRAPLMNMMALGFSNFLTPFMDEVDAIGYSMQFIPALFGALIVFPIYYIGKILFNKKAGLAAAFFIAIIPIHIGSGHGSAYSLFDHDSFNLFLYFITFLFMILSIKEKDNIKSIFYALLAGVSLAGLSMVWTEARFLYVVIAIYAVVQMIIDIFSSKIELNVFRATAVTMLSGYLISLPVISSRWVSGFSFDVTFFMVFVVVGFGFLYYLFGVKKIPWTLSLPFVFIVGGIGIVFLYFAKVLSESFKFLGSLNKLSDILFGTGIYGNKVSMTIAEANTYEISQTVMNFGPALYWVGWAGFIFVLWYYYKDKLRRDYLFFIVVFIVYLWLTSTAGRFLNDMVPLIAIFAGFIVWFAMDKIDYKQMIKNIRSAGGGLHGIRRGVKIIHVFGIVLLAFVVILPNIFITLDAAIPNKVYALDENKTDWGNFKQDYFADENYSGVFGLSLYKESYWTDAFNWLAQQDTDIEKDVDRPAFISWWDYGFYGVALSDHPMVADNFQDGIPPASNFHTATSEKDAVAVLIVRILEGNKKDEGGKLSDNVRDILAKYLDSEKAEDVAGWIESPEISPSYTKWIDEDFNEYVREEFNKNLLKVGAQWAENAVYHDVIDLFNDENGLTEEEVTLLYLDLQEETGYSIRYYGVEGYDRQIFNIFAFLSDKSLVLLGAPEDGFIRIVYVTQSGMELTLEQVLNRTALENNDDPVSPKTIYKNDYFDTMFYRTYIGPSQTESTGQKSAYKWQVPCIDMKHFYAEFISDLNKYQYSQGQAAVVIAKYYAGALINGTVTFKGEPVDAQVVVQKNLTYTDGYTIPIDHDKDSTNDTGYFSLLVGAGSHLQIRKTLSAGGVFVFTNITFEGDEGTVYAPISDDDAMRKRDSNYERTLNIDIKPANLEGYFYEDVDGDDLYDSSVDTSLSDGSLMLYEIKDIVDNKITIGSTYPIEIDEATGYYNASDLLPGYYRIVLEREDRGIVHLNDIALYSGNKTYNFSEPAAANLQGTVYYNKDDDENYTAGDEKIAGANVELILSTNKGEISLANTTSDSNGGYSFESLLPGQFNNYSVIVTKDKLYEGMVSLTLVENETKIQNISLSLTPVTVSGYAKYLATPVEGATVIFEKDGSVLENTAVDGSAETNADGYYTVSLQPGSYNITVIKGTTTIEYYLDGEKITLAKAQGTDSKDFSVDKKSVTVTGETLYGGSGVDNVTVMFNKDNSANNTAVSNSVKSSINGDYSIELSPGSYTVSITPKEDNVAGVTYIYKASEGLALNLYESDIAKSEVPFNIDLIRELKEESS
jgi:dolichyl-phosphooligosaccharide-protein glycotransferase